MASSSKVDVNMDQSAYSAGYDQNMPQQQYNPSPAYTQPVMTQPSVSSTVVQVMTPGLDVAKPPYPERVNAWTTGLCDCCSDFSIFLCGLFCGPCLACQVAIHMNENCCTPCCGGLIAMRTKLRTRLGIRGSINSDCCATTCCGPCAVCQMEREMNNWGI